MFKNMADLNLIPEKLKRDIEFKKLLGFINKAIIILIIVLFIYLFGFLFGKYILSKHYQETKESFALTNQGSDANSNDMDNINKKINFINTIQANRVIWSKLIYDISLTKNDGLNIESLSISKDKKMLNIRGEAETREKLLEFKTKLEKIPYLSEIIFPLQSLFKKNDISFDIMLL
jgi:capsular polysaccharide biosynthesis protein